MSREKKEELIRAAFEFQNGDAPHIIYDVNYWLFGESKDNIPLDHGKYVEANLDPRKIGREIEAAIRKYNHA